MEPGAPGQTAGPSPRPEPPSRSVHDKKITTSSREPSEPPHLPGIGCATVVLAPSSTGGAVQHRTYRVPALPVTGDLRPAAVRRTQADLRGCVSIAHHDERWVVVRDRHVDHFHVEQCDGPLLQASG